MGYRIIALDLDGTLLTPAKTILPQSIEALKRARQAGVKVAIVTGLTNAPSTLFIRR